MIKILEVNNIDTLGNRYNGYDMIEKLSGKEFEIKQAVIEKRSDNPNVIEILKNKPLKVIHDKIMYYEEPKQSIKNVLSITTPALFKMKEYKEADIVHIHMLHNSGLSLYALKKIAKEKRLVVSMHDPWLLTGRCVHYFDCNKWKTGCKNCEHLDTYFPLKEDNCHELWELKKNTFNNLDVDIIYPTEWTGDNIKESPILGNQNHLHRITFGIDIENFSSITREEARKKLGLKEDEVVLFHRAQNEFKGTPYVLEALKELETDKKVVIMTCENKGLLDEVKDKVRVMDLGLLNDKEMITAMNACDIFLMPSIGESFGLMAVEAMVCSKPVVVFDNSALPYTTHAPECGYLVKNRDSHDLSLAIKHLVEDEKDRIKRGKLGRKIVEEEYTNEKYYKELKKMYLEVYNRKREKQEEDILPETNDNTEQFKYYLNDITIRLFGTTNKYGKSLMYKPKSKRIDRYKYQYSDSVLQEATLDYFKKLEDIAENNPDISFDNNIKLYIEKTLYLVVHNPKFLLRKLMRK